MRVWRALPSTRASRTRWCAIAALVETLVPTGEHEVLAFDSPAPLAEAVETLLELEDLGLEFFPLDDPLSHDGLGALDAALGSPLDSSPALFHLVWGS
ncbi:hypothetical protein LZ199_26230 [Myxococcus sp. QH3KD-4-1]|nr:hypothetical protein [Myxococcus qinghaiensis]